MWLSPQRRAHCFKQLQEFHDLKAAPFQTVALASTPCTFVLTNCRSSAVPFQNVALVLAPRTFVFNICKSSRIEG
eukprot:6768536-Pyramimonas_sp.AAC.1